jgi:aminoglycoside/choline kinase family phosphotransferase
MLDHSRIKTVLRKKIGLGIKLFDAERLQGDASNRTYYRLRFQSNGHPGSLILMELAEPEAFKQSEEKISRSTIRIQELPYINILNHLAHAGVAVPKLYFYDRTAGLLFLEDLGDRTMEQVVKGKGRAAIRGYYERAINELIKIQTVGARSSPKRCVAFGRAFDTALLMWEFDHFLEYGIPYCSGRSPAPDDGRKIRTGFFKIARELSGQPRTFTHRDYHSRNLMIHRNRIWVLDFQDALMGPHVYDLASLLRDSYTVLDEPFVDELVGYYRDSIRGRGGRRLGAEAFRRLLDLMSIQRNLKAAGRFVYIHQVKRNPAFLPYIPQTLNYVRNNLEKYPELSPLRLLLKPYLEELPAR